MSREKILLVEDDIQLGDTLSAALARAGFVVTRWSGAADALREIPHQEGFAVLVTDFSLGNPEKENALDGLDVARCFRRWNQESPMIMITGSDPAHPRIREFAALPGAALVEKPFALSDLLTLLPKAV